MVQKENPQAEILHRVQATVDRLEQEIAELRASSKEPPAASGEGLEDLRGSLQIMWRFFIEPAWQKIYELETLVSEAPDPNARRIYPGEDPGQFPEFPGKKLYPGEEPEEEEEQSVVIRGLPAGLSADEVKKIYVLRDLERLGGNKMKTARSLKMNIKTLYNNLQRWGLREGVEERRSPDAPTAGKLERAKEEGEGRAPGCSPEA